MHRAYAPDIATMPILPEDESHHCVKVLRLHEGDEIEVVDGRGVCYTCRITMAHPKRCAIEVLTSITEATKPAPIVLAVAPTKHLDRMEWMVEKCTEMGIDRLVPLLSRNSERRELKTERLRKIMVAAMKQSLHSTLPQLDEMTPVGRFIDTPFDGDRFIAYCDPMLPREHRRSLPQLLAPARPTLVMIGPEGDFEPGEVQAALQAGFIPVTLGNSRLRTETAAVKAVAAIHTVREMTTN